MSLSDLSIITLLNKSIDVLYNCIKIDTKYKRRILYYQYLYSKYNTKYLKMKLKLESALAQKDEKDVKIITKKLQIIYDKLQFIKGRIEEYEKLSNNSNNNSN